MTDTQANAPDNRLYHTIWRWHFYAGLICLPFLVLLATTGALYLFRDELSLLVERDRLVATDPGPGLTADALIERARAVQSGDPVRFKPAPEPGRSAIVGLRDNGQITDVFLDPASGRVLDKVADGGRPMDVISRVHSLDILGPIPNLMIELVGGWAILLVVSGIYLWWPRGRREGVVTVRATPKKRIWWRDVHAVAGAFTGAIVLFLAVTGMPWSGFWGQNFREIINNAGLGMPARSKATSVASDAALAATSPGSWTMDPMSPPTTAPRPLAPLPIAEVVRIAAERGVAPGYVIRLPTSPGGVYTISLYPRQATRQRVIHLDQYSGKVLADIGLRDYGAASKAVEMGIAIHQGGQFGRLNQFVMLAGCLGLIVLAAAGAVMWWRRRPEKGLGAPVAPSGLSVFAIVAVIIGLIYPLVGLSIIVAFLIDRFLPALFRQRHAL